MNSMIGEDLEFLPSPESYQYQKKYLKKKACIFNKNIIYYLYKYGVHLVSITFKAQWEGVREGFKSPVLQTK